MLTEKDVEKITKAMSAIRLFRDHYGSGVEGQQHLQEVLKLLSAGDSIACKNIAVALDCANRMKGVQEAPHPSASKAA